MNIVQRVFEIHTEFIYANDSLDTVVFDPAGDAGSCLGRTTKCGVSPDW